MKIIFLFLFIFSNKIFAQSYNIDYLGIVCSDIDQNMAKMTSDLYYTQLNEMQEITVFDKRLANSMETFPHKDTLSGINISFFTEIKKSINSDKWITTIHVINPISKEEHTKENEYDSFYKVLMESKNTLKETILKLLNNETVQKEEKQFSAAAVLQEINSTEFLSGTWAGEEFVDKIVIMRGGRGFIIFKNGATMNINVSLEDSSNSQKVVISQKGRSNASFYPNLPRNIAMEAALEAEPLEWTFNIADSNLLSGSKKTLTEKDGGYTYTTESVTWKRVQ